MRREKGPNENGRVERKGRQLLFAGLALVAIFAAVSCGGTIADERAEQAAVDLGPPSRGEEAAPIVLIEYSDFQ